MIASFMNMSKTPPVGSIIAYAGITSTPISSPPNTVQTYPAIKNEIGITNNIEGSGWMVCDGRSLYCRAYPELFNAIGFLYTSEKGTTDNLSADQQFSIPDFRGYFLRGFSGSSNNDPDVEKRIFMDSEKTYENNPNKIGSIQEDALQTHQHQYSKASDPSSPVEPGETPVPLEVEKTALTSAPTDAIDANPSNGGIRISSETRSKNMYVNYLIKYAYV